MVLTNINFFMFIVLILLFFVISLCNKIRFSRALFLKFFANDDSRFPGDDRVRTKKLLVYFMFSIFFKSNVLVIYR